MELRELAEQVLFSASLEEKLSCPSVVTDDNPGKALIVPTAPGRPAKLSFKSNDASRSEFPGTHELASEENRSKLLHFFANHELLATELMALVLLKFPDAPTAFRKGVLQTLKDEQAHTRMYLKRMRDCGMEFGELPLSGYFWRMVSPMEHPIDYVSSLCLTFEQANLDFSKHFAGEFGKVGDADSANLMEKIYRDEIGHVAYGLKWFRRWKDPAQTDWDAFCQQLKFPLSPQRAKGLSLNIAGRKAAGLDAGFISRLEVYSQSKGRTPNVFLFNALAEGFIAGGSSFTPGKFQRQLVNNLENLPQFLCRRDDVVLVNNRPRVEFLSAIKQAGFALPEFVELENETVDPKSELAQRKLNTLRPWAWSPDSVSTLSALFANTASAEPAAKQRFNENIAPLFSKTWSAKLLGSVLEDWSDRSWLCTRDDVGIDVNHFDEAMVAIDAIRRRGHHRIVIKESIGVAGSNAIRLWEPVISDSQKAWINRALKNGSELVVEPWLDRVMDFSAQLEMEPLGIKLCGYTTLINDLKGQFQANSAEPNYRKRLPSNVRTLFSEPVDIANQLQLLFAGVLDRLEVELQKVGFLGPIGIDAFVYRADGKHRLKPIVEINPRYTMGRLTVELMKHVVPGAHGEFRIINKSQLRAEGFDDFASYAKSVELKHPIKLEGHPKPRICTGAVFLNDPETAQVCLAVFQVG
jgi:uncharacterized ferritin-like protein (DUF455 family)